ncbi:MAG: (E)-4-hydroxy-3-methylbut-2-enyl-diphosphate synthase [Planctomycetes bacterium]|nr:(E)-4-hydroxy-3-methylbut-2-enyl-diphosphate synthase [Planctomycetota bacterium]
MIRPFPSAYVDSRLAWHRRDSLPVRIGALTIGGGRPVAVQSMCTTPTQDVAATVAQCIALAEVGCEIIRVTAPGVKDAHALKEIRRGFSAAGFAAIPLVADIHFMPAAAMEAIEHVEKVRVNPGNFADKKRFATREYSDADYQAELERVAERFSPLARRAKELGRALRIGTNHGSLSDRIMNRWGDSPAGMVESALEFVRIAESVGLRDLVISMKSSNPKVMVEAYRLLVAALADHGAAYPLHLGVTEAGDGEDGRIKSAAGIGALLEDGIGDTIRVSLTEPPEAEVPVARALVARYAGMRDQTAPADAPTESVNPFAYQRRASEIVRVGRDVPIGGGQVPRVLVPSAAPGSPGREPEADARVDDRQLWRLMAHSIPGAERCGAATGSRGSTVTPAGQVPLITVRAGECVDQATIAAGALVLLRLEGSDPGPSIRRALDGLPTGCLLGIAEASLLGELRAYRLLAAIIDERFAAAEAQRAGSGTRTPICLALPFLTDELAITAVAGALLIDGIGDCVYLPAVSDPRRLSFTLLQAVKARVTRADYVACPSCGRTQFDLMEVTAHIKEVTAHLDGITIAIMGCIVNGPGEMADADFGYVGSGPGKIDLYRGKELVRRNLASERARDELVSLIKEAGKWREPDPVKASPA